MDDIEKALVATVIELSAVRRLREKQLRLFKILQANGGDISEVMQGLEASQLATDLLRKRRKELATLLVKSRSKKEARSPGGVGEGMVQRRASILRRKGEHKDLKREPYGDVGA